MVARTVKGSEFTIIVDDKRITVKHLYCKGKRCRVIAPAGVRIETTCQRQPFSDHAGQPDPAPHEGSETD
jgi:hypothetical protein